MSITGLVGGHSGVEIDKGRANANVLMGRLLTTMLGGTVEVSGSYPGWQYRQSSPLRDLVIDVFTGQYGYAPSVEAIHAGLECGVLCEKLPSLDCVAFGPDLKEVHTCRENMSISSVQRVWKMLLEVLRRMNG